MARTSWAQVDELAAGMHPCSPDRTAAADPQLHVALGAATHRLLRDPANQQLLRDLFATYGRTGGRQATEADGGRRQEGSTTATPAVSAAPASIALAEVDWVRLCKDLRLCPRPITLLEVMACAHLAKPATWRGSDVKHPLPLTYPGERCGRARWLRRPPAHGSGTTQHVIRGVGSVAAAAGASL